jgi:hypothetical protein
MNDRDRFAGIALSTMTLSVPCPSDGYQGFVAKACYDWADAMMQARDADNGSYVPAEEWHEPYTDF